MIHTDNESFLDKIKWVFTFFQPKRSDVYLNGQNKSIYEIKMYL